MPKCPCVSAWPKSHVTLHVQAVGDTAPVLDCRSAQSCRSACACLRLDFDTVPVRVLNVTGTMLKRLCMSAEQKHLVTHACACLQFGFHTAPAVVCK